MITAHDLDVDEPRPVEQRTTSRSEYRFSTSSCVSWAISSRHRHAHLANDAAGGEVEIEHTMAERILVPVRREIPILRAGRSFVAFLRLPRSPALVVELADLAVEHNHASRFEMCQHAPEPFEVLVSRSTETERAAHHHRAIPARQVERVRRCA